MLYFLAAALLVVLDQVVKFLVRAYIPLHESIPFLPHLMNLTYVQNTGAAFSSFSEHTWMLAVVSAVASLVLAAVLAQKKYPIHPFGRWALAAVLAGAVGNLIDRVAFGFVTDMFQTTFIHFAVFNVADICVVLGGIALVIYYLFLENRLLKKGDGDDNADSDRAP
jgi:signal peptidase II